MSDTRAVWARWYPCWMIVLATLLVRWPLASAEFGRSGDGTGSFYGIIARNYLLRANGPTLWMPVISVGDAASEPTVYAHHPPGVPLLTAASMCALGDSDFAVRLPALLCTLAAVAALYGAMLGRGEGRESGREGTRSRWGATCAAMLLAFVPLSLRFGQMPDVVNSQLALVGIWIACAYARWLRRPTTRRLAGVVLALIAGFLTDWPAFYFAVVMGGHLLTFRPRGWLRAGVVIATASVVSFGLLYIWVSLASHDWSRLVHQFLNRSARSATDDARSFTLGGWVSGVWRFNMELHGGLLLASGTLGILAATAIFWARREQPRRGQTDSAEGSASAAPVVALLGAWAVLHVLVGRQGVLNHDWWWWPVTVALCAGAGFLASLPERRIARGVWGIGISALCIAWVSREMPILRSAHYVDGGVGYTPRELGAAVKSAADPGHPVMLFQDERQPYVSYNANRPLIQPVWDVDTLNTRLTAGTADLFYTFTQETDRPPAAVVIPKVYLASAGPFISALRSRYRERDTGKFLIFELGEEVSERETTGAPR